MNSRSHDLPRLADLVMSAPEIFTQQRLLFAINVYGGWGVRASRRLGDALVALGELQINEGEFEEGKQRLESGVTAYQMFIASVQQNTDALTWASVQSCLGYTLRHLGQLQTGSVLLEEAMEALNQALRIQSLEKNRRDWALTMDRLGTTLQVLSDRESGSARRVQAIEAYRQALLGVSRQEEPLMWAQVQGNLGTALDALGQRQTGTVELQQAAQAHYLALKEYRRDLVPSKWALIQHNLGATLWALGTRTKNTANLTKAIRAYRSALEERTRAKAPFEWAMTQVNLGCALRALGERERNSTMLKEAIASLENALSLLTPLGTPFAWAQAKNSLANTYASLGELEGDQKTSDRAAVIHLEVLQQTPRESQPFLWALLQSNLAHSLTAVSIEEVNQAQLERAIEAAQNALLERSREDNPLSWASTMLNLGAAKIALSQLSSDDALRHEGTDAIRAAWSVLEENGKVGSFEEWPPKKTLSLHLLEEYVKEAIIQHKSGGMEWLFGITLLVLRHFMGNNWIKQHLYDAGILKPPSRLTEPLEQQQIGMEGYALAEMLFNLQEVEGFEDLRLRLLEGNVAAVIGELEAGAFLKFCGEEFRFVKPRGQKGSDYDLEIVRPQTTLCGEVKVKSENEGVSEESFYRSLKQARTQLPKGSSSVVFVRVAGTSDEQDILKIAPAFQAATRRLLRQTSRVVGAILLTRLYYYDVEGYSGYVPLSVVETGDEDSLFMPHVDQEQLMQRWRFFANYRSCDT